MSDPIDIVRVMAPPVAAHPELLDRVRKDLMTTITPTPQQASGRWSLRRRAILIGVAALLSGAAAGWAIFGNVSTFTELQCPENSIIDAVSGDPVQDCANQWRFEHGAEPPAMSAYDNGTGGVVVLIDGDPVPEGYTPLESDVVQDTARIELEASLGDVATGLESGCYDEATAHDIARRELDRLGLDAWRITTDETRRPDGSTLCAYFLVFPDDTQVQLIGLGGDAGIADPFGPFATSLHDTMGSSCLDLAEAADVVRSLAANSAVEIGGQVVDFSEEAGVLTVHIIEDAGATCTRVNVNIGGRVEVTLRGPKA